MSPVLYFVVPCYNDELTLPSSVPIIIKKLDALVAVKVISADSRLVLINDGSSDHTWECIVRQQQENSSQIIGLNLARNFGEQNALIAGMTFARKYADCVITMDSDLQDDINTVDAMLDCFQSGKDIVFGVRNDRSNDGVLERTCSDLFYLVMKAAKTGLVDQHSNYRLMSRKAINRLLDDLPANYFLPCTVSCLGLSSAEVNYRRLHRICGKSGYNLAKKITLAKDAVFSHSTFPLKMISFAGMISFLMAVVFFVLFLIAGEKLESMYFFPVSMFFMCGTGVFAALRIVGEYSYKAFSEAKKSKKYQIDSIVLSNEEKKDI